MPADVIGTAVVRKNGEGRKSLGFQPGPSSQIFLLADEINRATPKTQSALLEAMQEKQVTVAHTSHQLEEPFFVMATQNPLEMEELIRCRKRNWTGFYSNTRAFSRTRGSARHSGPHDARCCCGGAPGGQWAADYGDAPRRAHRSVAPHVQGVCGEARARTHPEGRENVLANKYIRYGSSPRGAQTLILGGKVAHYWTAGSTSAWTMFARCFCPLCAIRIILNFEAQADAAQRTICWMRSPAK